MKEEAIKKGKPLKDYYPPNSAGNPLKEIKLFISYGGNNSALGIHTTTSPGSIGHQRSHGCTRLEKEPASKIAHTLLRQDGKSEEEILELFEQATKNPKKELAIQIKNGPEVVYLKK